MNRPIWKFSLANLIAVAALLLYVSLAEAAGTQVQAEGTLIEISAATGTHTFTSTATSGNLLIGTCGVDKNSGAFTADGGWTLGADDNSTSVSQAWYWKVSDGTETDFVCTWTTNQNSSVVGFLEYSGLNNLDVTATNPTDETSPTSVSTGTTATTTVADARAFALCTVDSGGNTSSRAFTNSFTIIQYLEPSVGGGPGHIMAELDLSTTGPQETTFSNADDQTTCDIFVFNNGGGGGSTVPVFHQHYAKGRKQ